LAYTMVRNTQASTWKGKSRALNPAEREARLPASAAGANGRLEGFPGNIRPERHPGVALPNFIVGKAGEPVIFIESVCFSLDYSP
jgi:hypothetical protein